MTKLQEGNFFERLPLDTEELKAMLSTPIKPQSSIKTEVPAQSSLDLDDKVEKLVQTNSEASEEQKLEEARKKFMILPTDKEKRQLQAEYPGVFLRVVPMPYTRPDGKMQTYILRQLTRAQWTACKNKALTVMKSKPDMNPDDIFAEYLIREAVVWPSLPVHIQATPAGLVETLFGVIQNMGLFFDPAELMAQTFPL